MHSTVSLYLISNFTKNVNPQEQFIPRSQISSLLERNTQQPTPTEAAEERESTSWQRCRSLGRFSSTWLDDCLHLAATDTVFFYKIVKLSFELWHPPQAVQTLTPRRYLRCIKGSLNAQTKTFGGCQPPALPRTLWLCCERTRWAVTSHLPSQRHPGFSGQFHCFLLTKPRSEANNHQKLHSLYENAMKSKKDTQQLKN